MDDPELLELGSHQFTGVVKTWGSNHGELLTDSGVTILFVTKGFEAIPEGMRITIVAKKFRPRYRIEKAYAAE
jgi:hypothetical protein